MLKRDEIWRAASNVCDHYSMDYLAISFGMQPYIVKSIKNVYGSNQWMKEPSALRYGIRKKFKFDTLTGKLLSKPNMS